MATLIQHPSTAPAIAATRLLASYDRHKLEAFIEIAIGLLDMIDGDPDLEDDDASEDDDPAGGNVEDERQEEEWRPEGISMPKPIYGVDQSAGPVNTVAAHRQWRKDMGWPA